MVYPNHQELQGYTSQQLHDLCQQLREDIISTVAVRGGHLASSLGAVELCVALHRIFELDGQDRVFFDVGHQAYAHKLLSGRAKEFSALRSADGCSGFPSPAESPADPVIAGHAGVALSQALGAAEAKCLRREPGRVIAVVGDGALGCGISWEALNNAQTGGKRLILILNDNQMSISPNLGALRKSLNNIIAGRFYNRIRNVLTPAQKTGGHFRNFLRRWEHGLKWLFMSNGVLFQEFGFRYFGPIDGNNLDELCKILPRLPQDRPVMLHVVTKKGLGFPPAEQNPEAFHGVSGFDRVSGQLSSGSKSLSYSEAFSQSLTRLAEKHSEVVAISAAMLCGTGLKEFARRFPDRCFDTGIAESHSLAFASGLAASGLRPVVVMYSTFLQRALDNVYHDICLNNLPVIFGIDRTGAVPDGPTHHGIYALPFLRHLPNLTVMSPADEAEMDAMLEFAWQLHRPVLLRYPRAACIDTLTANQVPLEPLQNGKSAVIRNPQEANLTIWATGAELSRAWEIAEQLEKNNSSLHVRLVNARFLLPFDEDAARTYAGHPQVAIDDYTTGGLAECLAFALKECENHAPLWCYTWPENQVLPHGSKPEIRRITHLTVEEITADILARLMK